MHDQMELHLKFELNSGKFFKAVDVEKLINTEYILKAQYFKGPS